MKSLEGTRPFLDCLIVRDPDGKLQTTVNRKPTDTGRYMQFNSSHSLSTEREFNLGLFLKAGRFCSTENLLLKENSIIKSELQMNGYLLNLIKSVARKCNKKAVDKNNKHFICTSKIWSQSRNSEQSRYSLAFSSQDPPGKALSKVKDDIPMEDNENLVYKLSCDDRVTVYVGETSRELVDRIREHRGTKLWWTSKTWKEAKR